MNVVRPLERLNGDTKINYSFKNVINDYREILKQYTKVTGDVLNNNPRASVEDYPLKECRYTVSIIIPAWNSLNSLRYTLQSLCYSGLLSNFTDKIEVILIDDGSDDDIQSFLDNTYFPYKILYIRQCHLGRAQALNTAISQSKGEIIIFCDADLIVPSYALDELIKRQQEFLNDAIFFGFRENVIEKDLPLKIEDFLKNFVIDLEKDNRFLTDFPGLWGTNIMMETNRLQRMSCEKNIYVTNNKKGVYDCWELYRMAYGFLFSVSRKNILKVGGFAEYLKGWGFDDTEFCAKCILQGVLLIPVPSSFVGHIYHPIREKTQWKDGAENRKRMEKNLRSLEFKNYINDDINTRIEIMKIYNPTVTFKKLSFNPSFYKCVQDGYRYYYVLGDKKTALKILLENKINCLLDDDIESLCDLALRLNRKDAFDKIKCKINECENLFYFKLCLFVFYGTKPSKKWNDKYVMIARNLGAKELYKRANIYMNEKQWYLALRDYFGAYLLSRFGYNIMQKCNLCVSNMVNEKQDVDVSMALRKAI